MMFLLWTSTWATSLLTMWGIGGSSPGKVLDIQLYDITSDSATIQWNKVIGATSYCVITVPYFGSQWVKIKDCKNIWNGGDGTYVWKYTFLGKANYFAKNVYIGVLKGDEVVYVEKMDKPLGDFKVVKNTDDFKLIVDRTGKPIYAEDWQSDDWFAYLLADNIDYDGDGKIEWCYENIWYDKGNCVLYIYSNWVYVSPPTNGKSDIALPNNNYDGKHPKNAQDFCSSLSWFGKKFYLPSQSDFYYIRNNTNKIVGLNTSSRYWLSDQSVVVIVASRRRRPPTEEWHEVRCLAQ